MTYHLLVYFKASDFVFLTFDVLIFEPHVHMFKCVIYVQTEVVSQEFKA